MPLTWTHRREVGHLSATCRTAGAEGRFFPILCADAGLRRTFESALKEAGGFDLKLEKIPARGAPGGPWPEALREHRGDHYNRVLWCLDFAPDDPFFARLDLALLEALGREGNEECFIPDLEGDPEDVNQGSRLKPANMSFARFVSFLKFFAQREVTIEEVTVQSAVVWPPSSSN